MFMSDASRSALLMIFHSAIILESNDLINGGRRSIVLPPLFPPPPRKTRLISLISLDGLGANYERVGVIRRHNPRNRKMPGGCYA